MSKEKPFNGELFLLFILFALLLYKGGAVASRFFTWAVSPGAGSIATLSDNNRLLRVASDEKTLEQATKAEQTPSESGMNELLRSGRVFLVPNGTRVQVLEVGWTKVKVRIAEGEHTGRVGYVPIDWVKAG